MSKKGGSILRPSVFNWLRLISTGNPRGNSTSPPETPANQIKAPMPHTDFHWTQKLTSRKKKTIQNKPKIDSKMLSLHSINPFIDKISTKLLEITAKHLAWGHSMNTLGLETNPKNFIRNWWLKIHCCDSWEESVRGRDWGYHWRWCWTTHNLLLLRESQ